MKNNKLNFIKVYTEPHEHQIKMLPLDDYSFSKTFQYGAQFCKQARAKNHGIQLFFGHYDEILIKNISSRTIQSVRLASTITQR